MKFSRGFTMIEMVFVIVVLGILAAIAVPRLAATRDDADIAKGRADVASIRSAIISERQTRLIVGCPDYIPNGTGTYACNGNTYNQMDNGGLFGGVLMYSVTNQSGVNGKWSANAGSGTYQFRVMGANNTFTYTPASGTFICTAGTHCSNLTD